MNEFPAEEKLLMVAAGDSVYLVLWKSHINLAYETSQILPTVPDDFLFHILDEPWERLEIASFQ